ncbi:MAG TPA: hypothetical protein VHM26_02655 [Chitinophagaceae bacterium]|nr:hypothetical protein [Chitinophagaceae bacterium]
MLPLVNVASILLFFTNHISIAYLLLIVGSFGLLALTCSFLMQSVSIGHVLLVMGAFAWLTGNLLLFNHHSYPLAVKWWMLFLAWTILGERLDLGRMLPISLTKQVALAIVIALNLLGVLLPFHPYGGDCFAAGLIAMAIWFFLFDISRYSIKIAGQSRYIAIQLMMGYAWLAIAGTWLLLWPFKPFSYDATLHSFFLGFVLSMIFGHIPIIFPGILRLNIRLYHPSLYIVLVIFQLSLLCRMVGDALLMVSLRKYSAMVNGISIIMMFITVAIIIATRVRKRNLSHVAAHA